MSLKQKTASGLLWSFLEDLGRSSLLFVCGIVMARLLSPREFGLIGMTTFFTGISQALVDSGFSQALIRKQACTKADYTTVFFFNTGVSLLACLTLFLSADAIGGFFNEPELPGLLRMLSLGIVVGALGQVQRIQITQALDFKLLTRISILSSVIGGGIGVALALGGYGIWSLVAMTLCRGLIETVLLWGWRPWRPSWMFDRRAFNEMFAFGSPLLAASLISMLYRHASNLVIGKYFSAGDLGQFTQAQTFRNLPSERLTEVLQRVSYPVLSTLQEDIPRLRSAYRRLICSSMLVTFVLMLGMAASAEALVLTLVGEVWRPAIAYLRLLCFVGALYPLHAINLNMLKVRERSDLTLKLSLIKTAAMVPAMAIGIFRGIPAMIVATMVVSVAGYLLTAFYSGRLIGYSLGWQLRDILPPLGLAAAVALPVHFLGRWLPFAHFPTLILQAVAGAVLAFGLAELTRIESYVYLKGFNFPGRPAGSGRKDAADSPGTETHSC